MSGQGIRRRLFLGSAVGALTLGASRAAPADTAFTRFSFAATGAPTNRTMPDRLGDVINVKDWGALGNFSHNDQANVQAAIDYAISLGGGRVFFPAGSYLIAGNVLTAGSSVSTIKVELVGVGHWGLRV